MNNTFYIHQFQVKSTDTPPATPPLTPPAEAPTSVSVISTGPATTSFPASDSRSSAQQASPSSRAQEVQSVVKELHAVAATVNSGIVSKLTPSPTGQTTSESLNLNSNFLLPVGQKPSRNLSSGSTHSASQFYPATGASDADQGETISRAEFNEFRAEILKRLAKLEERILLLDAPMEPSERHHL
jgi:hypothetical protein